MTTTTGTAAQAFEGIGIETLRLLARNASVAIQEATTDEARERLERYAETVCTEIDRREATR